MKYTKTIIVRKESLTCFFVILYILSITLVHIVKLFCVAWAVNFNTEIWFYFSSKYQKWGKKEVVEARVQRYE